MKTSSCSHCEEQSDKAIYKREIASAMSGERLAMTVLLSALNLYQKWISPLLGNHCRFAPSCSEYAKAAVVQKGILKGTVLAVIRISKCHPMHAGGYDPVV